MSMQEIVQNLAERAQKEEQERYKGYVTEVLIKTQSAAFSQAQAYTNVIIVAGYVAFFTIWSFTKDSLPNYANLWAATLMSLSAICFVTFEIYKMIVLSKNYFTLRNVLNTPADQFKAATESWERKSNVQLLRFIPIWYSTLIICVSTGYLAAGILVYHFFKTLFGWS